MAGRFSLGGGGGHAEHREEEEEQEEEEEADQIPPESHFLYTSGGASTSGTGARGFELWQHHQRQQQQHLYSAASGSLLAFGGGDEQHIGPGPGRSGMRNSSMSCQDCGNQAKKDCSHMRCRTCCKSRGFHCPTHIKSTWVPAAKRRERQHQLSASAAAIHHSSPSLHRPAPSAEPSKRPRDPSTCLFPSSAAAASGSRV